METTSSPHSIYRKREVSSRSAERSAEMNTFKKLRWSILKKGDVRLQKVIFFLNGKIVTFKHLGMLS